MSDGCWTEATAPFWSGVLSLRLCLNPKEETQQEVSQLCGFTSDALSPGDVQRMLLTSQEEEVGRRWWGGGGHPPARSGVFNISECNRMVEVRGFPQERRRAAGNRCVVCLLV